MNAPPTVSTEVIAFSSGKGGTGKTSLLAALGYALKYSGHSVLMIDADRATDGFSLFILGPQGMTQIADFKPQNTFSGLLGMSQSNTPVDAQPRIIHRSDHALSYDAIISGKDLYGDPGQVQPQLQPNQTSPPLRDPANTPIDRQKFQQVVQQLFQTLRNEKQYDYVLVDTRGGFSFESTDVAAAADSFVLVTEATYTNFYQDRNLVDRINTAASQMQTKSLLRGIIVNKSTEGEEQSFRNELTKEFRVRFEDTFSVAMDLEAAAVYKRQLVIYREAPASRFAYDSLKAFHQILKVVTSQWIEERAHRWNELVAKVDAAIAKHNADVEAEKKRIQEQITKYQALESESTTLKAELASVKSAAEQETRRQDILLAELKEQARLRQESYERERTREKELLAADKAMQTGVAQKIAETLEKTQAQLTAAQSRVQSLEGQLTSTEHSIKEKEFEHKANTVQTRNTYRVYIAITVFLFLISMAAATFMLIQSNYRSKLAESELLGLKHQLANQAAPSHPIKVSGMFTISCDRLDMCSDLVVQSKMVCWHNGVCNLPTDVPGGPNHSPTIIKDDDWKMAVNWRPSWPPIEKGYRCQNCWSEYFELPEAFIPPDITVTNVRILNVTGPFAVSAVIPPTGTDKTCFTLQFRAPIGTINSSSASVYWYGTPKPDGAVPAK